MAYEIKNFQTEFADSQEKIGKEVVSKWKNAGQTNAEQLKKLYSGENFDPETKFYAFKEKQMVGFLTSTIQKKEEGKPLFANLEIPLVLESDKGASKLLFEKAVSKLKEKGVKKIRTRAAPYWGNTIALAEEYGFNKDPEVLSRDSVFNPKEISIPDDLDLSSISEYEKETDRELLISFLTKAHGTPEEELQGLLHQLDNIESLVGELINHSVLKESGKIVGHQFVFTRKPTPEQVTVRNPLTIGENADENTKKLFYSSIKKMQKLNKQNASYSLFGKDIEKESKMKSIGLKFEDGLMFYSKDI